MLERVREEDEYKVVLVSMEELTPDNGMLE